MLAAVLPTAPLAQAQKGPIRIGLLPPLTELTAAQAKNVIDGLKRLGFDMPGITSAADRAAA